MSLLPPEVLHPAVISKLQLRELRSKYPDASTWEWCPECGEESVIPAYRESPCPHCGHTLRPCSMCLGCLPRGECPYE